MMLERGKRGKVENQYCTQTKPVCWKKNEMHISESILLELNSFGVSNIYKRDALQKRQLSVIQPISLKIFNTRMLQPQFHTQASLRTY